MPSHIRRAEQFEREAQRGIGHVKSPELKDVIKKLRLYHNNAAVNGYLHNHILTDLKDSITKWSQKQPKEFAARLGPNLAHEVMVELTSSSAEHLNLVNGDILFRWVPRGIDQRKPLQGIIAAGQDRQDQTQYKAYGDSINLGVSVLVIQHVGIYSDGEVIEIGETGLKKNPVSERVNFDLVVRSRLFGHMINAVAKSARCGLAYIGRPKYPVWDLATLSFKPHPGARLLVANQFLLKRLDDLYRGGGMSNVLQQTVICSHFVNAVLYAAIWPNGTLATATDHTYDDIFKISPAEMWKDFKLKLGIWSRAQAVFIGLQHKGKVDRNMDPRQLGVGLSLPPVPKKAERPTMA
ncbi:MAG: hypothetical protein ABW124_00080 [Candidatus Thiodiazotropha sp. 6PLUC9]